MKIMNKRKTKGQSLVEFALTITLSFLFLAATIDLGLAFFALQGLNGAAQEGAAYAALRPTYVNSGVAYANDAEIRARVRYEGGVDQKAAHRVKFVDLINIPDSQIKIEVVPSATKSPNTVCSTTPAGRITRDCEMKITVLYKYSPFFPVANLVGLSNITLKAERQQLIAK